VTDTSISVASKARTNWLGLASTIGLFLWFLFWHANEPYTIIGKIWLWTPLALIHWFGIQATKRRFGWVYIVPLGVFWILLIIGLCGGIPTS
jgi:hypothetical protein